MNRRDFAKAAIVPALSSAMQGKPAGPNDRIRMAVIGMGGRACQLAVTFLKHPDVAIPVICDVNRVNSRKANDEIFDRKAEMVEDYRRVLDRNDIDAVLIGSPDHWHAIQTIHACQAGKDIYLEKPASHCLAEGRSMVRAARKYDRIVQVGSQALSGEHYHEAARVIQGGGLGKISYVRAWNVMNRWPAFYGTPPDEPVPDTLNWDLYVGPAPLTPYNPLKASGRYRNFWAFGGGIMADWGAHHVSSVHQLTGATHPLSAVALGRKYVESDFLETPDTFTVLWDYPDFPFEFTFRDANAYAPEGSKYGILFHGTEANLFIDRVGFEIVYENNRAESRKMGHPHVDIYNNDPMEVAHTGNFLDCVRSRKPPAGDIETGHRAMIGPHLGNISLRTGRKIFWDAEREANRHAAAARAAISHSMDGKTIAFFRARDSRFWNERSCEGSGTRRCGRGGRRQRCDYDTWSGCRWGRPTQK